jgi:hypothetical protein
MGLSATTGNAGGKGIILKVKYSGPKCWFIFNRPSKFWTMDKLWNQINSTNCKSKTNHYEKINFNYNVLVSILTCKGQTNTIDSKWINYKQPWNVWKDKSF